MPDWYLAFAASVNDLRIPQCDSVGLSPMRKRITSFESLVGDCIRERNGGVEGARAEEAKQSKQASPSQCV